MTPATDADSAASPAGSPVTSPAAAPDVLGLVVPLPAHVERGGGKALALDADTVVTGDPAAVGILCTLLQTRTGGAVTGRANGAADPADTRAPRIALSVSPGGSPESYELTVTDAAAAVIGADAAGLFYGIQTLVQLIERSGDRWRLPAVSVADAPRFAYRGLMLDVARHFFPVEVVRAVIDRAASLKLNHLHLHLTDDQGWRIRLASRPALTEAGAGSAVGGDPGGFYTAEDYAQIVAYAASRHMTVVPEIDLPGHTHAVGLAYPELAAAPVLSEHVHEVVAAYGGSLPVAGEPYTGIAVGFSSLVIGDERTDAFITDVVTDLAAMTPGPYLHLGGDEALGTDPADYAAFVARATRIVADAGKIPIAWHEAGAAEGLHPGTVGQYWGFVSPTDGMDEKARAFVARGGRLILSPADAVYLDMKEHADAPLGLVWANGPTSLSRAYAWEPGALLAGVPEEAILGVEAALWTETIRTQDDIDAMMFPRVAAAAEAAWSPATGASPARTWDSFRERVGRLGPLWATFGIRFTPSPEVRWAGDEHREGPR